MNSLNESNREENQMVLIPDGLIEGNLTYQNFVSHDYKSHEDWIKQFVLPLVKNAISSAENRGLISDGHSSEIGFRMDIVIDNNGEPLVVPCMIFNPNLTKSMVICAVKSSFPMVMIQHS